MDFFDEYSLSTLILLAFGAFSAGFVDAVVGGGGLIQIPVLLINFPQQQLATLFGTNKIAALAGTSISAYHYSKRITFDFKILLLISFFSFLASYLGATLVRNISSDFLKPILLVVLLFLAVYTFYKKELGSEKTKDLSFSKQVLFGAIIGLIVGFYDGFFGPGTGSFFVIAFVIVLGFDFFKASAYAKIINCFTNLSALLVFVCNGNYILEIAVLLSVFNITGSFIGTKMAVIHGNKFIRKVFLGIVLLLIVRYSYDIFGI